MLSCLNRKARPLRAALATQIHPILRSDGLGVSSTSPKRPGNPAAQTVTVDVPDLGVYVPSCAPPAQLTSPSQIKM
jgi:hypothetical protein